ncbi:MAG: DsbA family protein [Rhizobiaceae bacterium]
MKKIALFAVATLVAGSAAAGLGYVAGQKGSASTAEEPQIVAADPVPDDAQIEKVVRNYLLTNPEIMLEVQTALETKREEQSRVARNDFISKSGDSIFNASQDAIIGNPKGDVTVVEFFDYNCGYCRRALGDMQALVKADPNVRFVLKELPILGPDSVKAHIVAQAFKKLMPEKYAEFHVALLEGGQANEDTATAVAVSLGADEAKLKAGMEAAEIGVLFEQNNALAQGLNVTGTPAYVIKDEVVPGALGLEVLAEKVANVRQCQKATC